MAENENGNQHRSIRMDSETYQKLRLIAAYSDLKIGKVLRYILTGVLEKYYDVKMDISDNTITGRRDGELLRMLLRWHSREITGAQWVEFLSSMRSSNVE